MSPIVGRGITVSLLHAEIKKNQPGKAETTNPKKTDDAPERMAHGGGFESIRVQISRAPKKRLLLSVIFSY